MTETQQTLRRAQVTVEQVLPVTGLAYVRDATRSWAITRSTRGVGVDTLHPGQTVDITLVRVADSEFIGEYVVLND